MDEKGKQKGNSMIAKVIEMLGEEKDKIAADVAAESKLMAEYTEWCDDTITEHSYAIKSATEKITDLTAVITDATARIAGLDDDIASLGNEIAERTSEMSKAEEIRAKDHAEFEKAETEQSQMVEDLEQMMVEIKEQMAAIAQTPPPAAVEGEGEAAEAGFVQLRHVRHLDLEKMKRIMKMAVNAVWVDPETKKNLAQMADNDGAFVQEDEAGGPTKHLDEAQEETSDNMKQFEDLKGKAEEALQRLRDEEVKKQNEHDVQMMTLKQQLALAENDLDDAKREKARLSQEKAEASEELVETEAAKAADEKGLKSTTAECTAAAEAWATRQSEAKLEQAAIDKAKEILASRVTVFMQVSQKNRDDQVVLTRVTRSKLVNHFRSLGNKLHSLAMLNLVSVASSDPMAQVKGLLTSLIAKLEKEAKEAADLHEFCKAEKEKTSKAIKKKTMTMDQLDARIEKASTKKETLEENIADLTDEIASIDKTQAEATAMRNEEHANFVKVTTDFTGAAEAVDDAIDALKEYYGSFIQTSRKSTKAVAKNDAPPVLGGAKSDSAGGIMSILETMGEEFRKTVKTAGAEERAAQDAYDTLTQENKVSKSSKEAEIKGAQSEIKSLKVAIKDNGEDHKMASKELASINEYVAKLKPQCGGRTVPYEERKAKMEAEIAGLKEGLAILEDESPSGAFSFLQIARH